LPGKPGIALRLTHVGGGSGKADANAFIDPNQPAGKSPEAQ
jgi:hypothetical protein